MSITINNCKCEIREEGKSFNGWNDYYEFRQKIDTEAAFKKTPVENFLYDVGLEEVWYQCVCCDRIWRLIEPDPPFAGVWNMVDGEENSNE